MFRFLNYDIGCDRKCKMNLALQSREVGTLYRNPFKHEDGKKKRIEFYDFHVFVKEMFLAGSVESRTALFRTKKKEFLRTACQSPNFLITASSPFDFGNYWCMLTPVCILSEVFYMFKPQATKW